MNQEQKQIYMTTKPVEKLVCKMAIPTIISMLVTTFYNMVDTFFMGKINNQATGAVGIVFSMMAIIQALGFTFGHGSGVYISRELGKKEVEKAERIAVTGFVYSFICGVLVTVLGLLFLEPLAYALGSTDTILPYAKDYLRIILIGAPIMTSSLVLNNQLRYQGNAVYAMVGIVAGAIINIGLDPLFIFVFDWGITGAALATVISQAVSFALLIVGTTKKGNLHINFKKLDMRIYSLVIIVKGGLPSLFRQGLASIASISLNHAAGPYGDEVIAGMTIVSRVMMFTNSAMIGFGQGFQPVCGFNYGAGLYKRVKKAFYFCVKVSFIFLVIIAVLSSIFAPFLVELFRKGDEAVKEVAVAALRYNCITLPLNSWIVLTNMMLQSAGKAFSATLAAAARQGIFYLPIVWVFASNFGILGIELAQPAADICTLLLSVPLSLKFLHEITMKEKREMTNH
ncbi:MAG: MATE family efflux transporter [Lachnospiraceae bacterium]|nr:MATE family efflux transporter [Lachnospiraceae bacterium]